MFVLACASCFFLNTYAQEVEDYSYGLMLDALLTHDVPEVGVLDVRGDSSIVFLDARAKEEYRVSHIEGAIWVGYDEFSLDKIFHFSKNKKYVVYCSVGYRSEVVTRKLRESGFEASNLYGGIFEWKNQKMNVFDSNGVMTDTIHVYDYIWGVWLHNGVKKY